MPQSDSLTFFTQIFWLILVFLSFYTIILKVVLPMVGTTLKTRRRFFLALENRVESSSNEEKAILLAYETLLINSMGDSKQLISQIFQHNVHWLAKQISITNKASLFCVNTMFLSIHGAALNNFNILSRTISTATTNLRYEIITNNLLLYHFNSGKLSKPTIRNLLVTSPEELAAMIPIIKPIASKTNGTIKPTVKNESKTKKPKK